MRRIRVCPILYCIALLMTWIWIPGVIAAEADGVPGHETALAVRLGGSYSDLYSEFAPLYLFYRSYGDHLFKGTPIEVPGGLPEACERLAYEAALLQIDVMTQTASTTIPNIMPELVRLRIDIDAYCVAHVDTLLAIAAWTEVDNEEIKQASDVGLFSGIRDLSSALEMVLDGVIEAFAMDLDRWYFGIAFSMRGVLTQPTIGRMDENLPEILYGSPDAVEPPIDVPEDVARAMARLIELCGRELTASEAMEVRGLAEVISNFIENAG